MTTQQHGGRYGMMAGTSAVHEATIRMNDMQSMEVLQLAGHSAQQIRNYIDAQEGRMAVA